MKDFSGRGALITGGASGIGFAMADAFAARGMRIVLCDRDEAMLSTASGALRAAGADVLAIHLDVCDRAAWRAAVVATNAFGRLNVVCANAGISPSGAPISETTPEAWDRIVAINLTGVFNTIQATAPLIKEHGEGGHIVLTSSMAGVLAASPIGDYAVTKFGVAAMGEALRAVESNDLYIFTHADYRPLVKSRFDAILSDFADSAQPGFREGEGVLQMMTPVSQPR